MIVRNHLQVKDFFWICASKHKGNISKELSNSMEKENIVEEMKNSPIPI
jgi:hypothetical protein